MKLVEIAGLSDLGRDAPKQLFGLGKPTESLFEKVVAVVGSRKMSQYGRGVVEKMIPRLVEEGWTIASGFMYGIDKTVHEETVKSGGKSIAVIGWGIRQHLNEDKLLTKKIIDLGGMIISEWEDQMGALWTFPRRNRIVAAISQRIYVIEAGIKSGSLITVELGEKLGREIWAVPGPVTSKISEGTNMLIATGRAKAWLPQQQVPNSKSQEPNKFQIPNSNVLQILENEVMSIDELVIKTGKSVAEIGYELTMLQLSGQVTERGGKWMYVGED